MASITIRKLRDGTKAYLRRRAAANGRSLEAEVRDILDRTASAPQTTKPMTGLDIFKPIRDIVEKYGPFELELPPRTPVRDPFAQERHRESGLAEDARPFRGAKSGRHRK